MGRGLRQGSSRHGDRGRVVVQIEFERGRCPRGLEEGVDRGERGMAPIAVVVYGRKRYAGIRRPMSAQWRGVSPGGLHWWVEDHVWVIEKGGFHGHDGGGGQETIAQSTEPGLYMIIAS